MAAEIINVTTEEQLEQALDIRKDVFVLEQKVPIDLEIDDYDRLDAEAWHVLIKSEGQYAATGRLTYYNKDSAKMQRIAVRKPFRSKGIGRVLMMALETQARELKLPYAVLDAQVQAEPFYRKLGYETISDEPFDDAGIPHVRMKKSCNPAHPWHEEEAQRWIAGPLYRSFRMSADCPNCCLDRHRHSNGDARHRHVREIHSHS